jgi:hypothetical protein
MLTNTETRILDRQLTIHYRTFDKAAFYQVVANCFPTGRGEELFENDAYEEYLESLLSEV